MPRIFMRCGGRGRFPISEILAQTPAIPDGCQWGIFLRNHDELTLEMVADDERDYMYSGVRQGPEDEGQHRDSPATRAVVGTTTESQELFTAMLLSLPGSPVLYYVTRSAWRQHLAGRSGRGRTPMQWAPDRNAGFSRCDPGRIYLPVIMDPIYGYQAINVEAPIEQRVVAVELDTPDDRGAQAAPCLARAISPNSAARIPACSLQAVLVARGRTLRRVLCVNNLSRFPQPVELDCPRTGGARRSS